MTRRSATVLAALALVVSASGCGGGSKPVAYRGTEIAEETPAPNFVLHDQHGRRVTMAGQRGHWSVVTFLYTQCPDVCPVIAGNLNTALRSPAARRAGLNVLSVSVDPVRDTPAAARRYARDHRLARSFLWALGTRAELAKAWRAYDVAVLPGKKGTVTHSTFELLVDPEGRERLLYDSLVKPADIVHDLNLIAAD